MDDLDDIAVNELMVRVGAASDDGAIDLDRYSPVAEIEVVDQLGDRDRFGKLSVGSIECDAHSGVTIETLSV
jgi:hypothetical protein